MARFSTVLRQSFRSARNKCSPPKPPTFCSRVGDSSSSRLQLVNAQSVDACATDCSAVGCIAAVEGLNVKLRTGEFK